MTVGAPTRPYLGESDIGPDVRLIVNLSLLDFELPVIVNSNHIVVDDWLQNTRAEKVFKTGLDQGRITRDRVFELAEVLFGPRRVYEGRSSLTRSGWAWRTSTSRPICAPTWCHVSTSLLGQQYRYRRAGTWSRREGPASYATQAPCATARAVVAVRTASQRFPPTCARRSNRDIPATSNS